MATIYDVARAAHVSTSTVSHVLNGTRHVREETRQRVFDAMQQLQYRPNSLARSLVRQETRTLALIVADNANPFFAELARGVEDYGFAAGYSVILCNSDRNAIKELAYVDMLISKRVDGIIYTTMSSQLDQLQLLMDNKIPLVTFEREYDQLDAVLLDNVGSGRQATEHLIELGHRRIACIAAPEAKTDSDPRLHGYEQALVAAGLPVDPDLIQIGDWTSESGQCCTARLFELPSPPTAIFACNDLMAIGALSWLQEHGVKVPADVSVIGFDNIGLSAFASPSLTTFAIPRTTVAQNLCQVLLDRIGGQLPPEPQRITLTGSIVVRNSTAPLKRSWEDKQRRRPKKPAGTAASV